MSDEKLNVLFVTSRPSRAEELARPAEEAQVRRMLEEAWATRLGVDVEKLSRSGTGTETSTQKQFQSPTLSASDSNGGQDVTTDKETDSSVREILDGIKNDDPGHTGGIVDIPF